MQIGQPARKWAWGRVACCVQWQVHPYGDHYLQELQRIGRRARAVDRIRGAGRNSGCWHGRGRKPRRPTGGGLGCPAPTEGHLFRPRPNSGPDRSGPDRSGPDRGSFG
jgi:hypothetical protein